MGLKALMMRVPLWEGRSPLWLLCLLGKPDLMACSLSLAAWRGCLPSHGGEATPSQRVFSLTGSVSMFGKSKQNCGKKFKMLWVLVRARCLLMIQSAFNSLNEALWKARVQLVGVSWSELSHCLLLGFVRML